MEDETIELACQLLSRLTDRDGWNEGRMGELVNLLADLVDPECSNHQTEGRLHVLV